MKNKKCPVCSNENWNYDITDGIFTWCGDCFTYAKNNGFFEKLNNLLFSIKKG